MTIVVLSDPNEGQILSEVESDADRLAILSDFGINVSIGGATIVGILDNEWEDASGISVQTPVLTVRMIDIAPYPRGEPLTIQGVSYTVAEIQDDGQGIANVILQKT